MQTTESPQKAAHNGTIVNGGKVTTNPLQRKPINEEDDPLKTHPLQLKLPTNNPLQLQTEETVAPKPKTNYTGLPDNLKAGVEALSGFSMDDVKVHYNSDKPAQLQALAYAQGTDIHVAPGQEQHLPHEAWHVVQQKQGRVQPTMQMMGGVAVNDDKELENEADVMGNNALVTNTGSKNTTINNNGDDEKNDSIAPVISESNLLQRVLNIDPIYATNNPLQLKTMEGAQSFIQMKKGVAINSDRSLEHSTSPLQLMKFSKDGDSDENGEYDTDNLDAFKQWIDSISENEQLLSKIYTSLFNTGTKNERIAISYVRRALDKLKVPQPLSEDNLPQLENLPRSEWWRLFIDKSFWITDQDEQTSLKFDNEKSPGFYNTMMEAFEDILAIVPNKEDEERIAMTFANYEEHHRKVIKGVMREIGHTGSYEAVPHEISKGQSTFPLSQKKIGENQAELQKISSAVKELIKEKMVSAVGLAPSMLGIPEQEASTQNPASWVNYDSTPGFDYFKVTNKLKEVDIEPRVNDLFSTYKKKIDSAKQKNDKLAAIASLVRALHVGHFFTDANGRLNVMFLMNKLLREEGFSPSIISDPALFGGSRDTQELINEINSGFLLFHETVKTRQK